MNSDGLLNNYKKNMISATNLFKEYPSGIVIAATAIIKYNNEIFFLIDGIDENYKDYCPNHYILQIPTTQTFHTNFRYSKHY